MIHYWCYKREKNPKNSPHKRINPPVACNYVRLRGYRVSSHGTSFNLLCRVYSERHHPSKLIEPGDAEYHSECQSCLDVAMMIVSSCVLQILGLNSHRLLEACFVRRLHRFKTKAAVTEQLLRSALIGRHGSQSASWGEVGACWVQPTSGSLSTRPISRIFLPSAPSHLVKKPSVLAIFKDSPGGASSKQGTC